MDGYDAQLAERLAAIMGDFPAVKAGKMFGMPGYKVNGKLAVSIHNNEVVAKLGAARAKELIGTNGIGTFEPMPGRAWKDWIKISGDPTRHRDLIAEAVEYVATNAE